MDASKIQQIIDEENQAREAQVASQAKSLIVAITQSQLTIKGCQQSIAQYRKQLKELTVQTLDATEILEG